MRASIAIGGVWLAWLWIRSVLAAWMSADGLKRVNVDHRKLMLLRVARRASSLTASNGQSAKAEWAAMRAAAPGSLAWLGASTTRHPGTNTRTCLTSVGG